MADTNDVMVTIGTQLDEKGLADLNKQLEKAGVQAKRTGEDGRIGFEKMKQGADGAKRSFVELAAKITAAYMAVKGMIDAYVVDAKANAKLTLALKNNTNEVTRQGKSVSDLTKEYKDFASAQQAATGIGDEVTLSLMGTLTTLGVMPKDLKRVTAALQDMEAATGMSADSMARAWARLQDAPDEALGALTRVGVKLKKEMLEGMDAEQQRIFVLEKLEKAFGGQAKAMADAAGGTAQAKAAFGDFLEVLGKIVVTVLGPLISGLTQIMTFFNNLSGPLQVTIVALGALGFAFISLRAAGITTFAALGTAAKGFFASLGPVGWAITILGTLATVIGLASSKSSGLDDISASIDSITSSISKMEKTTKSVKSLEDMLDKLSRLKHGSTEYQLAVNSMISSNDMLKASNVTAANSFVQIERKVKEVAKAMQALEAYELVQNVKKSKKEWNDALISLNALNLKRNINQQQLTAEEEVNYQYYKTKVAQMLALYARVDNLTAAGGGTGTSFFQQASSSGVFEGIVGPLKDELANLGDIFYKMGETANTTQSAFVQLPPSTTTDEKKKEVKDTIDLWQMRIDLMDDEFRKRRNQNSKNYLEEKLRIESLNLDKTDKEQALQLLKKKYAQEEDQILRDQGVAMMQTVSESMSIGTSIIKQDWTSALSGLASKLDKTLGPAFAGVVGAGSAFAVALDGLLRKKAVDFGDEVAKAMDSAATRSNWADLFADLFGVHAEEATNEAVEAAKGSLDDLGKAYKQTLDPSAYGTADALLGLDSVTINKYYEWARKMQEMSLTMSSRKFQQYLTDQIAQSGLDNKIARLVYGSLSMGGQEFADFLVKVVEAKQKILDTEAADEINTYMGKIQEIQDQVDTGRMNEEDARVAMIDQYNQAIAALQGVEGAEALILELEKERYRLQKGITEETSKQLLNQKEQQLLSQIDALEQDIRVGRRTKDYSTMTELQNLYSQLLGSMKSSGLFGTDVYTGIENRLADMVRDTIGTTGFAAQSGIGGAQAYIPNISSRQYQPTIKVDGRNTNTSQTIINAPLNLPPDLANFILRAINSQSSRSF